MMLLGYLPHVKSRIVPLYQVQFLTGSFLKPEAFSSTLSEDILNQETDYILGFFEEIFCCDPKKRPNHLKLKELFANVIVQLCRADDKIQFIQSKAKIAARLDESNRFDENTKAELQ